MGLGIFVVIEYNSRYYHSCGEGKEGNVLNSFSVEPGHCDVVGGDGGDVLHGDHIHLLFHPRY